MTGRDIMHTLHTYPLIVVFPLLFALASYISSIIFFGSSFALGSTVTSLYKIPPNQKSKIKKSHYSNVYVFSNLAGRGRGRGGVERGQGGNIRSKKEGESLFSQPLSLSLSLPLSLSLSLLISRIPPHGLIFVFVACSFLFFSLQPSAFSLPCVVCVPTKKPM